MSEVDTGVPNSKMTEVETAAPVSTLVALLVNWRTRPFMLVAFQSH
jgi:hypothetical protein